MKTLLFICLLLASSITISAQLSTDGKAVVYVYSMSTSGTIGTVKKSVMVDGKEIAEIRPERYFMAVLDPGSHSIHMANKKLGGVEMDFLAGKVYYLRIGWSVGMTIKPSGMTLIPSENGAFEIKQLKTVSVKNIKNPAIATIELK